MGENSKIEWTDATWNPIRAVRLDNGKQGWHCEKVYPACQNCYAEAINKRGLSVGTGLPYMLTSRDRTAVRVHDATLEAPLRWKKSRKIFVCSMTDLFAEFVTDQQIDQVFAVMAICPHHTFQVLTKRPDRMAQYLLEKWGPIPAQRHRYSDGTFFDVPEYTETRISRVEEAAGPLVEKFDLDDTSRDDLWTPDGKCKALQFGWPLPNVWLGTTIENQEWAEKRVPHLLKCPTAVRFVSCEPLLGTVDISAWMPSTDGFVCQADGAPQHIDDGAASIGWVICGGESGHGARPMHPEWARSLLDQCQAAGVPFHFKQWGEFGPCANFDPEEQADKRIDRAGRDVTDMPGLWDETDVFIDRLGKKSAGRTLDGRTWDEFPQLIGGK